MAQALLGDSYGTHVGLMWTHVGLMWTHVDSCGAHVDSCGALAALRGDFCLERGFFSHCAKTRDKGSPVDHIDAAVVVVEPVGHRLEWLLDEVEPGRAPQFAPQV